MQNIHFLISYCLFLFLLTLQKKIKKKKEEKAKQKKQQNPSWYYRLIASAYHALILQIFSRVLKALFLHFYILMKAAYIKVHENFFDKLQKGCCIQITFKLPKANVRKVSANPALIYRAKSRNLSQTKKRESKAQKL